jgi:DNA-binding protein H-NS
MNHINNPSFKTVVNIVNDNSTLKLFIQSVGVETAEALAKRIQSYASKQASEERKVKLDNFLQQIAISGLTDELREELNKSPKQKAAAKRKTYKVVVEYVDSKTNKTVWEIRSTANRLANTDPMTPVLKSTGKKFKDFVKLQLEEVDHKILPIRITRKDYEELAKEATK